MLGPQDLWIALALGVFFLGAKRLPELSHSLGQAMREFKKGVTGTADEQPPAPPAAPVKPEKSDRPWDRMLPGDFRCKTTVALRSHPEGGGHRENRSVR
jgi:TatA/E family protein of Tat protein translocase